MRIINDIMNSPLSAPLELSNLVDQPLYDKLKDAIREQVRQGRWSPGDRVPTVRQLSQDLGIAYTTVARGIRELVLEGVLDSNLGGGTRVALRRAQQRLGTLGILGYAPSNEIERSSACNNHLLGVLQEQVLAQCHTVVYDHQRPGVPVSAMFRDMTLVDGLLLLGQKHHPVQSLVQLTRQGTPVVWVADSHVPELASVNSANLEDTMRATRLLLERGHRRIALLDSPVVCDDTGMSSRLIGYRQAMAHSGVGLHPQWLINDRLVEGQARHLLSLDPSPTALICTNAGHFRQLHDLLKGSPVEPGNPLEACVYDDDLWHRAESLNINYLRIEQPWQQMADTAVRLLLEFIESGAYEPRQHELPSRIVEVLRDGSTSVL
jgi:DNA-binding LacI/PurR family transcriptional regulator